ncbi:heme o synthase [Alicyclobacillus shizuokensis]|uniref:heme o synthase n=1 Tax=Alicyclobacillus shizuokensis TaxID=392014 RepID=UPI000A4887C8|nr:heme o synthase [Alicyclobacillus shizuokensis]
MATMSVGRAKSDADVVQVPRGWLDTVKVFIELTKPRIMVLLLFTAYAAAIVARGGIPSLGQSLALLLGLALSTGGAAAVNMWYDRDIDAVMSRTARRPLPMGRVSSRATLAYGITLGVLSVVVLWVFANPLSALLSAAGFVYYAVIYTMWLKRTTPQNIVIGGGAGAFPPLVGWAAVTGHLSVTAWALFAIVFFWTPPHFWALALYKNADYVRAGIPMMPAVRGARTTKRQCVGYAVLLLLVSLVPWLTGTVHAWYVVAAAAVGVVFLLANLRMWREADETTVWAKRTFLWSLLDLPALFTLLVVASLV